MAELRKSQWRPNLSKPLAAAALVVVVVVAETVFNSAGTLLVVVVDEDATLASVLEGVGVVVVVVVVAAEGLAEEELCTGLAESVLAGPAPAPTMPLVIEVAEDEDSCCCVWLSSEPFVSFCFLVPETVSSSS